MDASGSGASIFCIFGAVQTGGFTLIRHALRATFPHWGEGLSVRLSILLCSQASASVRAFPLTGEGGAAEGGDG